MFRTRRMRPHAYLLLLTFCLLGGAARAQYAKTNAGAASFVSDAPLETIAAANNQVAAVVNLDKLTFAFSAPIKSFNGFNSALQKQHFNENYLQSDKFPYGVFKGKIIEQVNLRQNGTYNVRAKGVLEIHGVPQSRIINATVTVNNGVVRILSNFEVTLSDHKIAVPRVVNQKIAEKIKVKVDATLR